jgi:quercetin dioxygenase-like cupin family protein|tara:strand:- start:5597 stop:5875 length:279 start_codon:yes stop_codon:yes gene_type:complete
VKYPFTQLNISKKAFLRRFEEDSPQEELYWHRDKRDREITVLSGEGWMYQEEDSLPVKITAGDSFLIKAETWHRIIKGSTPLSVLVEEQHEQ